MKDSLLKNVGNEKYDTVQKIHFLFIKWININFQPLRTICGLVIDRLLLNVRLILNLTDLRAAEVVVEEDAVAVEGAAAETTDSHSVVEVI